MFPRIFLLPWDQNGVRSWPVEQSMYLVAARPITARRSGPILRITISQQAATPPDRVPDTFGGNGSFRGVRPKPPRGNETVRAPRFLCINPDPIRSKRGTSSSVPYLAPSGRAPLADSLSMAPVAVRVPEVWRGVYHRHAGVGTSALVHTERCLWQAIGMGWRAR